MSVCCVARKSILSPTHPTSNCCSFSCRRREDRHAHKLPPLLHEEGNLIRVAHGVCVDDRYPLLEAAHTERAFGTIKLNERSQGSNVIADCQIGRLCGKRISELCCCGEKELGHILFIILCYFWRNSLQSLFWGLAGRAKRLAIYSILKHFSNLQKIYFTISFLIL